jgi:hypothetical protein
MPTHIAGAALILAAQVCSSSNILEPIMLHDAVRAHLICTPEASPAGLSFR